MGRISKTHGYDGTVVLVSDSPLGDDAESLKKVFIVIDGLQVPFPVEEFLLLTDTSAHVQLEFVNNRNEALELAGCEVYSAIAHSKQKIGDGLKRWIGFAVHDYKYGNIGVIRGIEDYSGNIVLQIIDGGSETLISLYPELVTKIDDDAKILHIKAPDGIF